MKIDYYIALQHCRPKAIWTMGETYESLEWLDQQQTKPTHQELIDAYNEAKSAIDARKIWNSRVEFWNEFTQQEKIAITASTNDLVKFFFAELTIWNGEVWSDDARVQQGLDLLVSQGIIDAQRKQNMLTK